MTRHKDEIPPSTCSFATQTITYQTTCSNSSNPKGIYGARKNQEWGRPREELELRGGEGTEGRRQQQLATMGNCESKPQRLPAEQDNRERAILFYNLPGTQNWQFMIKLKRWGLQIKCKQSILKKVTKSNLKGHITNFIRA